MGNSHGAAGLQRAVRNVLKKAGKIHHKALGTCQKGKANQLCLHDRHQLHSVTPVSAAFSSSAPCAM